jgi:hypothetical protein
MPKVTFRTQGFASWLLFAPLVTLSVATLSVVTFSAPDTDGGTKEAKTNSATKILKFI